MASGLHQIDETNQHRSVSFLAPIRRTSKGRHVTGYQRNHEQRDRDGPAEAGPYVRLVGHRFSGAEEPRDVGRRFRGAKRIERNPNVLVAPCTFRGRPLAPPIKATARLLSSGQENGAEASIQSNYGIQRRIYIRMLGDLDEVGTYVEITPVGI